METTSIAIQNPIEAEFPVRQMGGGTNWYPCQVVGIARHANDCRLICLTETADGMLSAVEVEFVRPV
jgi:hypothetical protein